MSFPPPRTAVGHCQQALHAVEGVEAAFDHQPLLSDGVHRYHLLPGEVAHRVKAVGTEKPHRGACARPVQPLRRDRYHVVHADMAAQDASGLRIFQFGFNAHYCRVPAFVEIDADQQVPLLRHLHDKLTLAY